MNQIVLLLNGKATDSLLLREAVDEYRQQQMEIEVRALWESGQAEQFAREFADQGVSRIIAAGGDGTINDVLNGILMSKNPLTPIGFLPFGTANDFARAHSIFPNDFKHAFERAITAEPKKCDVGKINDRFFINVMSGGYGAEATADTPQTLKDLFGGTAYAITSTIKFAMSNAVKISVKSEEKNWEGRAMLYTISNSRFAGGGTDVAPLSDLHDGKLDICIVPEVEMEGVGRLLQDLMSPDPEAYQQILYWQSAAIELKTEDEIQLNLDGEPLRGSNFQIECIPDATNICV